VSGHLERTLLGQNQTLEKRTWTFEKSRAHGKQTLLTYTMHAERLHRSTFVAQIISKHSKNFTVREFYHVCQCLSVLICEGLQWSTVFRLHLALLLFCWLLLHLLSWFRERIVEEGKHNSILKLKRSSGHTPPAHWIGKACIPVLSYTVWSRVGLGRHLLRKWFRMANCCITGFGWRVRQWQSCDSLGNWKQVNLSQTVQFETSFLSFYEWPKFDLVW